MRKSVVTLVLLRLKKADQLARRSSNTYYICSLLIDNTGVFNNTAEEIKQLNSSFSQVCFYKFTFGSNDSWFLKRTMSECIYTYCFRTGSACVLIKNFLTGISYRSEFERSTLCTGRRIFLCLFSGTALIQIVNSLSTIFQVIVFALFTF